MRFASRACPAPQTFRSMSVGSPGGYAGSSLVALPSWRHDVFGFVQCFRARKFALLLGCSWTLLGEPLGASAAPVSDEAPASGSATEEIIVRASRVSTTLLETPAAVSVIDAEEIQLARPQLTLGESLARVPGVFTQNRQNFAQDLRISIRGFGARARFGLRGIKLIVDGIPATLPDGQGQLDTLQLSTAGRIEVIRGPSASLYGSAAGGVIRLESEAIGQGSS
ncbi:MAG TPA: Plug domain-containing protein, partial [Myxococcales bacterium]|nr:Plug domain-containing protein [Myxococcales bacterium]